MRTLEFNVNGQRLKKNSDCDFSGIVAGSVGYLKAKFCFSKEWDGCKKAASFWRDGLEFAVMLNEDDTCVIDSNALTSDCFQVSVTGMKPDFSIKSGKVKVRQEVY